MMEERELIDKSLKGDGEAFGTLVGQHQEKVFRHCLSILKDEELAQDLTQETFLQAYHHLDSFRSEAQFSTWLWRIAHNLCLNYLKKHPSVEHPLFEEVLGEEREEEDRELLEEVRVALQKLPEKQRVVFELYVFEKVPQKEIAARLKIPHGTVRSRLHTARANLRNYLRRDFFE